MFKDVKNQIINDRCFIRQGVAYELIKGCYNRWGGCQVRDFNCDPTSSHRAPVCVFFETLEMLKTELKEKERKEAEMEKQKELQRQQQKETQQPKETQQQKVKENKLLFTTPTKSQGVKVAQIIVKANKNTVNTKIIAFNNKPTETTKIKEEKQPTGIPTKNPTCKIIDIDGVKIKITQNRYKNYYIFDEKYNRYIHTTKKYVQQILNDSIF